MNATPPPDNSLSDRNAVAPLPISYPIKPTREQEDAFKKAWAEHLKPVLVGSGETPPDLNPVIRLLANAKEDLKELNDRLAERTQAFLERERQLLDRLRLMEAMLTETIYWEAKEGLVIYTTLDRRIVGRNVWGVWDESYPYRGPVKVTCHRPEN